MLREFLPLKDLLSYLEATLRVYNRYGRRDNIHKARIKILVKSLGIEAFRKEVEAEWEASKDFGTQLDMAEVERVRAFFVPPPYEKLENYDVAADRELEFQTWYRYNTRQAQGAGLPRRVPVAEEARHRAGRHDERAAGCRRRSRGSGELRPGARHAQPEPAARGREAERSLQDVDRRSRGWALRCRTSARSRT